MQTFLPGGSNFLDTALDLDNKRLLKQGVEAYQILRANAGLTRGWVNHPASKMWRGHEGWLYLYSVRIYDEIQERGYKAEGIHKITEFMHQNYKGWQDDVPPPWLYDERVQITHAGRLYEKAPQFYPQFEGYSKIFRKFVCCENKCDYFWPTHTIDYGQTIPAEPLPQTA